MSKIIIGTSGGKNVAIDIEILLPSRLLLTADSGGGKSYLLRRLLEQIFGKVMTITIDPEGEFATLREKFPFVLVGKGGETPADPRSANLLAQRLLELKASAVCDLYDLKAHVRHTWVKNFLEGLIEAPKNLRTPCIVIVDEAHIFCPEKGESEAFGAMVDLCTRGRKRGLCPVWATQRLAMISKDASSQLQNRLVGMQFEDVNRKRAAEMLGVLDSDKREFMHEIQLLEPGNFFALGRAISKERILVKVGGIQTTHPKAFEKHVLAPPPAPEKIKALLPKFADLPKEADDKARTETEFRAEIRQLKAALTAAQKTIPTGPPAEVKEQQRQILTLRSALEDVMKVIAKITAFGFEQTKINPKQLEQAVQKAVEDLGRSIAAASEVRRKEFDQLKREAEALLKRLERVIDKKIDISVDVVRAQPPFVLGPSKSSPTALPSREANRPVAVRNSVASPPVQLSPRSAPANSNGKSLGAIHQQIAGILAAYHPDPIDTDLLAAMCGRSPGGSWSARLSEVRSAGLLFDHGKGQVIATDECVEKYRGRFQPPASTEEVLELWKPKLGNIHLAILNHLISTHGEPVSRDELAAAVGAAPGGSFSARVSEVRSKGLITDYQRGMIGANKKALFLED